MEYLQRQKFSILFLYVSLDRCAIAECQNTDALRDSSYIACLSQVIWAQTPAKTTATGTTDAPVFSSPTGDELCPSGYETTLTTGYCPPKTCAPPLTCPPGFRETVLPAKFNPWTVTNRTECRVSLITAKSCYGCPTCVDHTASATCESGLTTITASRPCPRLTCAPPHSCGSCYLSTYPVITYPPFEGPDTTIRDCTVYSTTRSACRGCLICIPLPC